MSSDGVYIYIYIYIMRITPNQTHFVYPNGSFTPYSSHIDTIQIIYDSRHNELLQVLYSRYAAPDTLLHCTMYWPIIQRYLAN